MSVAISGNSILRMFLSFSDLSELVRQFSVSGDFSSSDLKDVSFIFLIFQSLLDLIRQFGVGGDFRSSNFKDVFMYFFVVLALPIEVLLELFCVDIPAYAGMSTQKATTESATTKGTKQRACAFCGNAQIYI